MSLLKPGAPVPPLSLDTLAGGRWKIGAAQDSPFTLVEFYRGLHCPICKKRIKELDERSGEFADRGACVVAVSMDGRERAARSAEEWGLEHLSVAYGLSEAEARGWGLYISDAIKEAEPRRFNEPGTFLVRGGTTLHFAAVFSGPFARAPLDGLLTCIDMARDKDYPPRGTG